MVPSLIAGALTVAAVGGCGEGGGGSKACDAPKQEKLDPRSVQMVLPNAPEAKYTTNPPTSGPHLMNPGTKGVRTEQLSKAVQVGVLETGAVLIQHGDLTAAQRAQLEQLAGDDIVVAPNADLPAGKKVVATAWTWKMTCSAVDAPALRQFIAEHLSTTSQMDGAG